MELYSCIGQKHFLERKLNTKIQLFVVRR